MSMTVYSNDEGGFLLHRRETPIGWVEGRAVGFRGFRTKDHAMGAARLGHEALRGWLTRERHSAPQGTTRGTLRTRRDGRLHWITLDGTPIGRLVDPATFAPVAANTFGFELLLPPSVNPVGGISAAQVIYHALGQPEGDTSALDLLLSDGPEGSTPGSGVQ